MEQRKVFEVFLISTQWILSWLDNNHLIMNWRLSGKYVILSLLIKTFFLWLPFTLCCAAHLQQLLTTLIGYTRKLKNSYMDIYEYTIQTVIQWKTASIFFININNVVFLLENHQLIIDWFLSGKTWNFEYWQEILEVFNSLCHGVCHNFPRLKRVSITLIWCKQ